VDMLAATGLVVTRKYIEVCLCLQRFSLEKVKPIRSQPAGTRRCLPGRKPGVEAGLVLW
jgi:hypothetical protein